MSGRHAWREAHRAARKACPAKGWVRACLPVQWMTDDAARRLGIMRPPASLASVPYRVTIALACAADDRRKGRTEAARMWTGIARRANQHRHLTPCPAFGA